MRLVEQDRQECMVIEAAFGSLLMLGLIIVSFILIIGQGRLLRRLVDRLVSRAISVIGCCAFVLFATAIGGQVLLSSFTGGGERGVIEPPVAEVSLSISPQPPIEQGFQVVITASSQSTIRSCSLSMKDESGAVTPLSSQADSVTFRWTPVRPGNYAAILTAGTSDGDASARESIYVVASPFGPPCDDYNPAALSKRQSFGGDWFEGKVHTGIDLLFRRTDRPEVRAVSYGEVKDIRSFGTGWGEVVFMEHYHNGRPVTAVYGHIVPAESLTIGESCPRGTVVGYVDPEMYGGGKSAPHLHFGLYDGVYRDDLERIAWGSAFPGQFPGNWLDPVAVIDT